MDPMDEIYNVGREHNPVEIIALSNNDPITTEDLKRIVWNGFFQPDPKAVSIIRKVFWKTCWDPLPFHLRKEEEVAGVLPPKYPGPSVWSKLDPTITLDDIVYEVKYSLKNQKTVEDVVSEVTRNPLPLHKPLWRLYNLINTDLENTDPHAHIILQCHHSLSDGMAVNCLIQRNIYKFPETDEKLGKIFTWRNRSLLFLKTSFFTALDILPVLVKSIIQGFKFRRDLGSPGPDTFCGFKIYSRHIPVDLKEVKNVQSVVLKQSGKRPTINDIFATAVIRVRDRYFPQKERKGNSQNTVSSLSHPKTPNNKKMLMEVPTPKLPFVNTPSSIVDRSPAGSVSTAASTPLSTARNHEVLKATSSEISREEMTPPIDELTTFLKENISVMMIVNVRDNLPTNCSNKIAPCIFSLPRSQSSFATHVNKVHDVLMPVKTRCRAFIWAAMSEVGFGLFPGSLTNFLMDYMTNHAELLMSNLIGPEKQGNFESSRIHHLKFWSPAKRPAKMSVSLISYGIETMLAVTLTSDTEMALHALKDFNVRRIREGKVFVHRTSDIIALEIAREMTNTNI